MKSLLAAGRFPNRTHTACASLVRSMLGARALQRAEVHVPAINDAVRVAYHRAVVDADPGAKLEGDGWTLSNGSTLCLRAVRGEEARHA
jgi:hypothetical protein